MPSPRTYTIAEAAALTGLHRNTIRQRVRMGQLEATVQPGKFGEEYRISHEALVDGGLLKEEGPLGEGAEDVLEADFVPGPHAGEPAMANPALAALGELYQRHEQAMFRLGYLQGELERVKALAETAESLRHRTEEQQQEMASLKRDADEAERLRRELERTQERLREMEALRKDLQVVKELAARQEAVIEQLETVSQRPWWKLW